MLLCIWVFCKRGCDRERWIFRNGKRRTYTLRTRRDAKKRHVPKKNGVIIRLFCKNVSQMENYRCTGFSKTSILTLIFLIKANMMFQMYGSLLKS